MEEIVLKFGADLFENKRWIMINHYRLDNFNGHSFKLNDFNELNRWHAVVSDLSFPFNKIIHDNPAWTKSISIEDCKKLRDFLTEVIESCEVKEEV